jgi:adenosyl cobinamide kinase/adenosyl cobinamide phosphate guanylyltransferase
LLHYVHALEFFLQVEELVELQLSDFDYLVTKRKLEDDDLFEDHVNNHTRYDRTAWGKVEHSFQALSLDTPGCTFSPK